MAATDLQWKAAFKRDVTEIDDSELAKLKKQYAASLEAGISKAGAAGVFRTVPWPCATNKSDSPTPVTY